MQAVHYAILLLATMVTTGSGFADNDIYGVAFIAQTVENLDQTIKFYTEVLGGMLISNFSGRNIQGDDHYYRMFQKEIIDARNRRVSPESVGVPDIRNGGTHRVNWDFVLFDNCLMWFLNFVDTQGKLFYRYDSAAGTAKNGFGHLEFWVQDDVNQYQLLQAVYEKQKELGLPNRGISVVDDMNSFEERNSYFEQRPDRSLPPDQFGIRYTNTRGPTGEKIEFRFNRRIANLVEFQRFCQIKAVHTAMLRTSDRISNRYKTDPIRLHGFHHVSLTVRNITVANEFYTSVIGGKLGIYAPQLQFPRESNSVFVQDDLLNARQLNRRADASYGYINTLAGDPSSGSVDISFINTDNIYFDLYGFNPRNTADLDRLDRFWSSPAYLNAMFPGFHVKDNLPIANYIINMERQAAQRGWNSVKANRAVDVFTLGANVRMRDYSRPIPSGGLRGFDYTFVKGPGGEQFAVAKFSDQARETLKASMLIYGSVSTAFPETNPYTYGGYDEICGQLVPTAPPTTRLPTTKPTTKPRVG